ncbi:hypothetical protein CCL21_17585 [Pseudomonas syringae]|nr:hypothetical protein CCL21_17585 [Pseudomonas syringae]
MPSSVRLIEHAHGAAGGGKATGPHGAETFCNIAPLQLPSISGTLPRRRTSLVAGLEPEPLWPIFTH